ncbi:ABC transporter substrate-binding protein [Niveibacterium sp. SC-1]|uniref:ABC transporter substrate-binding protein n=1 Tax=Niveibacterium sp. SC-1 TaxID=3135646 RepID=UPI00311F84A7
MNTKTRHARSTLAKQGCFSIWKELKRRARALIWGCFSLLALNTHAQSAASGEIVLGQSAALSGPAAQVAVDFNLGASLYFDEVNQRGGINGRKVRLRSLDDGYDVARTVANTKRLVEEEKVLALFGYVGSAPSEAGAAAAIQAGVPFLAPVTGTESLRVFNRYVFNVRASHYDETWAIVRHLTTTGLTRIAAFYEAGENNKGGLAGLERALAQRDLSLAGKGVLDPDGINASSAVRSVSKANPQAVVMFAAYPGTVAFVRDMLASGSSASLWTVSFVGSQVLADELADEGRGIQVSQVVPFPWDTNIPLVREYQKALAPTKEQPGFGSLEGYIAARVAVEGLKKAGPSVTRESFIKGLESLQRLDLGGFTIAFTPSEHNGSHFVDLTMITRKGRFIR